MDDVFEFIVAIVGLFLILLLGYSIFAGIWGFNPTDISWFNAKLAGTSFIGFLMICAFLSDD